MAVSKHDIMKFHNDICKIVRKKKLNHIEAIVWYCEENKLEIETIVPLIGNNLKSKLAETAGDLNLIPKVRRLPTS